MMRSTILLKGHGFGDAHRGREAESAKTSYGRVVRNYVSCPVIERNRGDRTRTTARARQMPDRVVLQVSKRASDAVPVETVGGCGRGSISENRKCIDALYHSGCHR